MRAAARRARCAFRCCAEYGSDVATTLVQSIAEAIAHMEGYYKPGTIAARNHNPGNLRGGPRQIGTDKSGYGIYADDQAGWQDLVAQVERNIARNLNLYEFFGGKSGVYPGYAPAADNNNPRHYAEYVAARVGVAPDKVLAVAAAAPIAPASSAASSPAATSEPAVLPGSADFETPWLPQVSDSSTMWPAVAAIIGAGVLAYLLIGR